MAQVTLVCLNLWKIDMYLKGLPVLLEDGTVRTTNPIYFTNYLQQITHSSQLLASFSESQSSFKKLLSTMLPTRVLQALKSIRWRYGTHHSRDGRRPEAERLVTAHYEDRNLERRGVESAEIV